MSAPFNARSGVEPLPNRGLCVVSVRDFLLMDVPPQEQILEPWLQTQGLAMIYAPRGIGKTHVSLGIAFAVATGGEFLGWHAPVPREVLFIDGEMPASALQQRLAQIIASHAPESLHDDPALRLITPDLQELGIPDLATAAGQAAVDAHVNDETKLIIVDNLSTLMRSGKENEGESWEPVQTWALRHRAKGRTVLFIHHAGKGGAQRGTSRREDALDIVIALKRPSDYSPEDGAAFEVHFEKARAVHGEAVAPFTAQLVSDEQGNHSWLTHTLDESNYERVITLARSGLKPAEIAKELDLNKSTVSRHMKRAREEGRLNEADT